MSVTNGIPNRFKTQNKTPRNVIPLLDFIQNSFSACEFPLSVITPYYW
jgi:hypothetical protein